METILNIPRPIYQDRLLPYIDKQLIKVLTGQRRVGKSYVLASVREAIRKRNPKANIIHVDLEDFAFSHIHTAVELNEEICTKLSSENRNYIFIDEIQEVEDFDKVIRSLNLNPANDIYVTGSNSKMLSSEIGSRLAGRHIEINVHPLTYLEFLTFHKFEDSQDSLTLYLIYGGMPYLRNLPETGSWNEYLSGLTDALLYRDVVTRHSVRNVDFLQRLMLYMADNTGQIFTAKRISDYFKSQRITGTVTSVQNFIDYICEAIMINRVRRWDIEGKRCFEIGEKYYFEDMGIRNSIVGYRPGDMGKLLENAVYNQLIVQGYDVKVGVIKGGKEIDFIANQKGEKIYIQVALNIDDSITAQRELGNLEMIDDNYAKYLITLRDSTPNTHKGIRMLSLRDFLTGSYT